MALIRRVLSRLGEDYLFLALAVCLPGLLFLVPDAFKLAPQLVHWHTLGILAGLMILSRGLEESGYLERSGRWLLARMRGDRTLALTLTLFSAGLSAIVTNDVTLFIVIPIIVSLRKAGDLPVARLIVFQALAVNAGSCASPIGNPQNLYLWQQSGTSFVDFFIAMVPLSAALVVVLLLLIPFAFPKRKIQLRDTGLTMPLQRMLFLGSLACYPLFLLLADHGWTLPAFVAVFVVYLFLYPRVLTGVDWLLLAVFVLMFINLGLLALYPPLHDVVSLLEANPLYFYLSGIFLSQIMSNVPAAIFLEPFMEDWRWLAWSVSVGGFGLAIGSLANLIALRLGREKGLWWEFHRWSLPVLFFSACLAWFLGNWFLGPVF